MKFSSNKCDRIIDINKNSPFGKKKIIIKDILKTPHGLDSEALRQWKILKRRFSVFRYVNPLVLWDMFPDLKI